MMKTMKVRFEELRKLESFLKKLEKDGIVVKSEYAIDPILGSIQKTIKLEDKLVRC